MSAPSFPAAWERYYHHLRVDLGRRQSTLRHYRRILYDFNDFLGPRPWWKAAPRDVTRFLDRPSPRSRTGTRTANTRLQIAVCVTGFYRWAHSAGAVGRDRLAGYVLPRGGHPLPRALALEQVGRLLEAASQDPRMQAMIWLAYGCGLRCAEIAAARVEHLSLQGSPPTLRVPPSKTERPRVVPLAPPVAAFLRRYLEGRAGAGLLVDSIRHPGRPLTAHTVSAYLGQHMKRAGVREGAHSLRHSFATELLAAGRGANLVSVSRALGHATTAVTETVYTSSWVGDLAGLAELLPDPRTGNGAGRNSEAPGLQNSLTGLAPWFPVDLADQLAAALAVLDQHGEQVATAMEAVAKVTEAAWLRSLGVTDRSQLEGLELDALDYPTDAQWETFELESGIRRGWAACDRLRDAHPDG